MANEWCKGQETTDLNMYIWILNLHLNFLFICSACKLGQDTNGFLGDWEEEYLQS